MSLIYKTKISTEPSNSHTERIPIAAVLLDVYFLQKAELSIGMHQYNFFWIP